MNNTINKISKLYHGDCTVVMPQMKSESIDLIVTDPPYLVNYKDRTGRTILGDRYGNWLRPAYKEMYRVLKKDKFCISFYGWHQADKFLSAWKSVGLYPVGHFVFQKDYSSSKRFLASHHECAYLLAKGKPIIPNFPMKDIIHFKYTGNKLHPTQKPLTAIFPIIDSFSKKGDVILDPFCGSGTTGYACKKRGRHFIGIEKDKKHFDIALKRLRN